ncbi:hypothetical protein B0H63DRAFT_49184 [Podospora didyma]|uniref:Extracellular membrane protein CFEM domain-containing protein n=1 Tax=Podospora didyma TaxID=330526 RepID=A0AAE0P746_9PEZI|nr:hypothetical protein B0H63DRAFT_49184 [Podospora didyma]
MIFANYTRLALLGAFFLVSFVSQAESTTTSAFSFPTCINTCAGNSGCQTSDAKCMCKAAKDSYLEVVMTCIFYECSQADFRSVDKKFLDVMESGCSAARQKIPSSAIKEAESMASSLIAKLTSSSSTKKSSPATTTAKPATTATPAAAKTTEKAKPTTSTAAAEEASSSTTLSSSSQDISEQPAISIAPTDVVAAPPPAATSLTLASSASSVTSAPVSDTPKDLGFADSSPFGSSYSSGSQTHAVLCLIVGLPLLTITFGLRR